MKFLLAAAAAALAAPAFGQTPSILNNPFGIAGKPVGTPSTFGQVGTRPPTVGTPVGPAGGTAVANQSAARPPGQLIDLKNLAAPLTAPLPPELRPDTNSIIDSVYERWRNAIGVTKPTQPATAYTPGLSRRNRERHKFNWWWE